jgi:DNA invertase Pin-like site-specific DNA recombinase
LSVCQPPGKEAEKMTTKNRSAKRVALYARVSTTGQTAENQLLALRSFAAARGWGVAEFVDHGQSGAKERRPALDALLEAVRSRRVDVVACVKLDRLARSVHHLVGMVREFEALGVDLVVLDQAIDTTTPAGRLLFHVLASISEFERDLIRDRVLAGLRRARVQGTRSGKRIGRPKSPVDVGRALELMASGRRSMRSVARTLGVSAATVSRALAGVAKPPSAAPGGSTRDRAPQRAG